MCLIADYHGPAGVEGVKKPLSDVVEILTPKDPNSVLPVPAVSKMIPLAPAAPVAVPQAAPVAPAAAAPAAFGAPGAPYGQPAQAPFGGYAAY